MQDRQIFYSCDSRKRYVELCAVCSVLYVVLFSLTSVRKICGLTTTGATVAVTQVSGQGVVVSNTVSRHQINARMLPCILARTQSTLPAMNH